MSFIKISSELKTLQKNNLYKLTKKVLDTKGFVKLVDSMPSHFECPKLMCDSAIVQAARVSYGEGLKDYESDKKLIEYLYKNKHTSPFEMVKFKFHVKAPIFIARQWFRHRMGNYNELSGRYSKLQDDFYFPTKLQTQSKENKQLSDNNTDLFENKEIKKLFYSYMDNCHDQYKKYEKLIELGVSREIARICLPQNLYTEFYWTIDLHNLFNFIKLRDSNNAQYEIKMYAKSIKEIIKQVCPVSVEAFDEYKNINISKNQLNSLQFSTQKLQQKEIKELKKFGIKKSFVDSYII